MSGDRRYNTYRDPFGPLDSTGLPSDADEVDDGFDPFDVEKYRSMPMVAPPRAHTFDTYVPSMGVPYVPPFPRHSEMPLGVSPYERKPLNLYPPTSAEQYMLPTKPSYEVETYGLVPPPLPYDLTLYPLEKFHYYTEKSPQEIHDEIKSALNSVNAVLNFDTKKFKFTCEVYSGYNIVRFIARAFTVSSGSYLVEFQRRSGCCLSCTKIFSTVRQAIHPLDNETFEPATSGVTRELEEKKIQTTDEALERELTLIQSCFGSSYLDVQREFSKVLIALSEVCPTKLRSEKSFGSLLCSLLKNNDTEVRLQALCCLANLASSLGGEDQAGMWLLDSLPDLVKVVDSDPCTHTKREAGRAIMYLSGKCRNKILGARDLGIVEFLKTQSSSCCDETLRTYMETAADRLVSC